MGQTIADATRAPCTSWVAVPRQKLYDVSESSMDELGTFEPSETGGFIKVQAIRLKKYGQKKELSEKM
jgi:hypothetical protein